MERMKTVRLIDLVKEDQGSCELSKMKKLRVFWQMIDALPERERLIISLYHYEGLTLEIEPRLTIGVTGFANIPRQFEA